MLSACAAFAANGCADDGNDDGGGGGADPIVGQWETDIAIACDRPGTMNIPTSLSGTGAIPMDCSLECTFTVQAAPASAGYRLSIHITSPQLCTIEGSDQAEYDCAMQADGSALDCGSFYAWDKQGS